LGPPRYETKFQVVNAKGVQGVPACLLKSSSADQAAKTSAKS
jgi:hypothetical protein